MATRYSIPDYKDQLILLLIQSNGGQCWYLAEVLNMSKASISRRAERLMEYGLIDPISKRVSREERSYVLTPLGEEITTFDRVFFQKKILELKSKELANT